MSAQAKHTPGPWRLHGEMIQCQAEWIDEQGGRHVDWRNPRVLAYVVDDWDQLVNGRLIAAAPELLAACQAALGLCEDEEEMRGEEDERYPHKAGELVRMLSEAIAKATGEAA